VVNPGAEDGVCSTDGSVVEVPGWVTIDGAFTCVQYDSLGFPGWTDPGPLDRGENFFAGGDAAYSNALQDIDISAYAVDIDAGELFCELSAWMGGYGSEGDVAGLQATFYDVNLNPLPSGAGIVGPVPEDRGNQTGLFLRTATVAVSPEARSIRLFQEMWRAEGGGEYNDGYIDNISLRLFPKTVFEDGFESANTWAWSWMEPEPYKGDECINPIQLISTALDTGLSVYYSGSIDYSTTCGYNDTADVWYRYTATCTGIATVTTCDLGTTFDTILAVFDGCVGSELDCVDDDGVDCGYSPLWSTVTFPVELGEDYFLRVSGYERTSFEPGDVVHITVVGCL
jgi:hypothetical protein